MTLENLQAIHRLQAFEATPGGVLRLLASAERNLTDAGLSELPPSAKSRNSTSLESGHLNGC